MKEWINSLLFEPNTAVQAIVVLSIIIAIGSTLGKKKIFGLSLGVTFVFFVGIVMGHLGFSIDPQMSRYAQDFGLVIFVYELGLQVGPGFFSSFRNEGLGLNIMALLTVLMGTCMALGLSFIPGLDIICMTGILCGACTCTPGMSAARQAAVQMGADATNVPLGWAVAYPMGVVGVILAMIFLRRVLLRKCALGGSKEHSKDNTHVCAFDITNPGIVGHTIKDIGERCGRHFVITRLWRNGKLTIPQPEVVLMKGDRVLVVLEQKDTEQLRMLFGTIEKGDWNNESIDWNAIDSTLVSRTLVVTNQNINGKRLASLRLRNRYTINITRVYRAGVKLLATPDLVLQMGDRVTIVGDSDAIKSVEKVIGNEIKKLSEPNLVSTCIGIILGLVVGSIPIAFPGVSQPVRLGLAGGPIIVGIILGRFGPKFRLVTYTTTSANLMLRSMGIELYLACLGLSTGASFFSTVMRPEGALWVLLGFLITVVPITLMGLYAFKRRRLDFGATCGLMAGSQLNPFALEYATDNIPGDSHSVAYATVYPLCMFARVIIAQLLILIFL